MWKSAGRYRKYLDFRDYLRTHPGEAERYYLLKQLWAKKAGKIRKKYPEMKTDYIREVLAKVKRQG